MTTPSFLDPLRTRDWRRVWLTGLSSYVGTWMQVVGAQWLMGSLASDDTDVALLQAAASLPYLILAVPAGVLGDIGSRRNLLIGGQAMVAISAALLAVLTLADAVTPAILLSLTAAVGAGQAVIGPAWLALLPGLLPEKDIPAGAALDGATVAIARVVGPVLGGVAITVAAPAADFVFNAVLSAFSVVVLLRMGPMEHARTSERVGAALRSGLLYTRRSRRMRVLVGEVATFSLLAGALWALLPNLARGQLHLGAAGYGLLLGSAGIGATLAAGLLPILRRRFSLHRVAAASSLLFACSCGGLALKPGPVLAGCCVLLAGGMWVSVVASLDALAQSSVPDNMRARTMAMYETGFQGGLGVAGLVWALVASPLGDAPVLGVVAGCLLLRAVLLREKHLF